jgi:hypothetical protein
MKLYPKCHPYWEIDGKKIQNSEVKQVAYIAQGYLLPCCWCDGSHPDQAKSMEKFGLFDEELKVENVDNIEIEILASPEWYKFHNTLLQKPHNAPPICKSKCSKP